MRERPKVRFRPHDWINLETSRPVFGVQAKITGRHGWMHVCDDAKALFFTQRRARDREVARLNRQVTQRRESAS